MSEAIIEASAPRRVNRGDVLHALQIIVVIGGFFMGWQTFKDTGADHTRRITILEDQKASKETVKANNELLTQLVTEQSRQIGELKKIVETDHDAIVSVNARMPAR